MNVEHFYRLQMIMGLGGQLVTMKELATEISHRNKRKAALNTKNQQRWVIKKEMYKYGILSPETLNPRKLKKKYSDLGYMVYFIQQRSKGEGYIKIGMTNSIDSRVKALQTASPHKLEVVAKFPAKNKHHALAMEKAFHIRFKKYRTSGEWFESEILGLLKV